MKIKTLLEESKFVGKYVWVYHADKNHETFDRILKLNPTITNHGFLYYSSDSYEDLIKFVRQLDDELLFNMGIDNEIRTIYYDCSNLQLTSLKGIQPVIKTKVWCFNNKLTSLKDVHKYIKEAPIIMFNENPIKSHVLGLFLIKGLTEVELTDASSNFKNYQNLKKVNEIVNKHLHEGRAGLPKAQNELIDASLEEYAQI